MHDKRKHILHVINALPYGGAERCVVDIVNNSDPAKFKFSIIVFENNVPLAKEICRPDVKIIIAKKSGFLHFGLYANIKKILKEIKPDIVHTHLFTADLWGRLAARKLGLPVVTTEHNTNEGEGYLRNFIKRIMRKYSVRYVACSDAVRKYMARVYDIRPEKVKIVRYGINLDRFTNLQRPLFIKPFRLLMIGRLSKQKGQAVALRALALLKNYDWKLQIVGKGELADELVNLVQELDLQNRVLFEQPSSRVPEFLESCDIFLMPSLWEGLGIVVMEAMSSGRTVVASKVGGITELLRDKEQGFLVESGNVEKLRERLAWCFNNPEECRGVGERAKEYAKENFSMGRAILSYEEIYSKL